MTNKGERKKKKNLDRNSHNFPMTFPSVLFQLSQYFLEITACFTARENGCILGTEMDFTKLSHYQMF